MLPGKVQLGFPLVRECSSSEMERSLLISLVSLVGLFSGDVSESFLESSGVSVSRDCVFASFRVDGATRGWLEESSEVSVVGFLGLAVSEEIPGLGSMKREAVAEELLGPGSMRRGAGDLGLAFFLRSSSMVGGMDLLDLELPSFELGDLLTLLRELEDLLFLAMLRTWKWEVVALTFTCTSSLTES